MVVALALQVVRCVLRVAMVTLLAHQAVHHVLQVHFQVC